MVFSYAGKFILFLVCNAALLKRQGVNVKGLLKADPVKEEPQPYIDCTGNLQACKSISIRNLPEWSMELE